MQLINLQNDPEELFFVKREIEKYLIEQEIIKEKMDLSIFVQWLNMHNSIYMYNENVIPFSVVDVGIDRYIFHVEENQEYINETIKALEYINYDFSQLIEKDLTEIYNGELINKNYFLINGKYYITK